MKLTPHRMLLGAIALAAVVALSRTSRADPRPWSLGLDGGVAFRSPTDTPPAKLFLPPSRPVFDLWIAANLLRCSRLACLRLRFDWGYDGFVPTRQLLEGSSGQPSVQTTMFAHELLGGPALEVELFPSNPGWTLRARAETGFSVTTLQYSSDADERVYSRRKVGVPGFVAVGLGWHLAPGLDWSMLEGGYRFGYRQRTDIAFGDDAATLPFAGEPFAEVNRQGLQITMGLSFRP